MEEDTNLQGQKLGNVDEVTINLNGGTVNGSVFGGANGGSGTVGTATINIEEGTTVSGNVFGGANGDTGAVDTATINIEEGTTVSGNVYGGANEGSGSVGEATINLNGGVVAGWILGGSAYGTGTVGTTNINLKGGTVSGYVFGGACEGSGTVETVIINQEGTTIGEKVFAGGYNGAGIVGTATINLKKGKINEIYGGAKHHTETVKTSTINLEGGEVDFVFGGGEGCSGTVENVNIIVDGVTHCGHIICGPYFSPGLVKQVDLLLKARNNLTIDQIFGGGWNSSVGTVNIEMNGNLTVNAMIAGCRENSGDVEEANINLISGTILSVAGGGDSGNVKKVNIQSNGASIGEICGGRGGTVEEATINLNSGIISGNIYGGADGGSGTVETANINLNGGTVTGSIYGGANRDTGTVETANINLKGATVNGNIYGGSSAGSGSVGTLTIKSDAGEVKGDIYGGANAGSGTVQTASITVNGGTVSGSIYGGANASSGTVQTASITVNGGTVSGSVYGGGIRSTIGTKDTAGKTTLNIVGGTIEGSVFGGSKNGTVYGNVAINIGKGATEIDDSVANSLEIKGDIYGGGNLDTATNYTDKLVTGASTINIDGKDYTNFKVNGNIFGSGRYSTVNSSTITIKNVGANKAPHLIQSVQRTDLLTIDKSNVEIIGASDSTNLNVEIAFTLNRIEDLKIKNGTTLHVRRGFNQVEQFDSLVDIDGKETKAEVKIENNNAIASQNVINRVYMYEGVNLIIAKEQYVQNKELTLYGKVSGMTFLGMYARDRENDELKYDVYDPDKPSNGNLFKLGGYVEGLYDENKAIKVDGFYTNELEKLDDPNSNIVQKYVDVITNQPISQDWIIGMTTYFHRETLIAKRSKDKIHAEVPLAQLNEEGVGYNVNLFSINSLESGINLIDKSQIPTMAETSEKANTTFALTMRNGKSGWKTQGETNFYSSEETPILGTRQYLTDDSGNVPTIDLYLYNSINISETSDAGLVSIMLIVKEINNSDLTQGGVFRIMITVNIQTLVEDLNDFSTETHIDKGQNYDLFALNSTHISERSSMTLATTVYPLGVFADSDYRALVSTCKLPIKTEITMIDYVRDSKPTIYYYEVTKDPDGTTTDGKYIYKLSNFTLMGSTSGNANYDNPNATYKQKEYEEYRFILDFKDATIPEDLTDQTITLEIMNASNQAKSEQLNDIDFNIYVNKNSSLSLNVTKDSNNVYEIISEGKLVFDVTTDLTVQKVNDEVVNDTYYDNKHLGIGISLYDLEKKNRISYEKIKGSYLIMDGIMYYPDKTGVIRIYLSDNIVNVKKHIELYIKGNLIDSGDYQIRIEDFASDNGTFYGLDGEQQDYTQIHVIDLEHGLSVEVSDDDRVIDANAGLNYNGEGEINFDIKASDVVKNANIRMILYRRDLTYNGDLTYADVTYSEVDLSEYVTTELSHPSAELHPSSQNEYLVNDQVEEEALTQLTLNLKDNLTTGGYKLVFELYSGDVLLGKVERHFVVTDLINVP